MTRTIDRYVTLARKTLLVPVSIMKMLTKIEMSADTKVSWYNQRKVYGKIFALGIIVSSVLKQEEIDDIITDLEDNDVAMAEKRFRDYITATTLWGDNK